MFHIHANVQNRPQGFRNIHPQPSSFTFHRLNYLLTDLPNSSTKSPKFHSNPPKIDPKTHQTNRTQTKNKPTPATNLPINLSAPPKYGLIVISNRQVPVEGSSFVTVETFGNLQASSA